MTEEVPAAPAPPPCNGSAAPAIGPRRLSAGTDEIAKSPGMVPYANAEMSPDAPPAKENLEENRNSLAEVIAPGDIAGEKRCQEKQEEKDGTLQQGPADAQDTGIGGQGPGEGPGGTEGLSGGSGAPGPAASPAASEEPRAGAAEQQQEEEEEEEEEEEDTEEDEVQVIEIKKENSEGSRPQQRDSGKESPAPGCNSPLEKAGEQLSLGKKNDISRHSYSRYNTISYRRIRKGNTKQRIDEFESMMHL